jgi:hypothetical protein
MRRVSRERQGYCVPRHDLMLSTLRFTVQDIPLIKSAYNDRLAPAHQLSIALSTLRQGRRRFTRPLLTFRGSPVATLRRGTVPLWIAAIAAANDLPIVTQDADFDPINAVGGPAVIRV